MPAIPESTKTSLAQRLRAHARDKWPQLATVHVRYHGPFAYVAGELAGGDRLPLMRLRYGGSAHRWGTAIYVASTDSYENQVWLQAASVTQIHPGLSCRGVTGRGKRTRRPKREDTQQP